MLEQRPSAANSSKAQSASTITRRRLESSVAQSTSGKRDLPRARDAAGCLSFCDPNSVQRNHRSNVDFQGVDASQAPSVFSANPFQTSFQSSFSAATMDSTHSTTSVSLSDSQMFSAAAFMAPGSHSRGSNNDSGLNLDDDGEAFEQQLAKEMYSLSGQERARIYDEIHGTNVDSVELQSFVEHKLAELAMELDQVLAEFPPSQSPEAYRLVMGQAPEYAGGRSFRLMCLRAKNFEVPETARLILRHFTLKQRLFCDDNEASSRRTAEVLGRPIMQSDLQEEDLRILRKGALQILPRKDVVGRAIQFMVCSQIRGAPESICRALFYCVMANLENDEQLQKRGVIYLFWMHPPQSAGPIHHDFEEELATLRLGNETAAALPDRPMAVHYCGPGTTLNPVLKLGLQLSSQRLRIHLRAHFGSPLECTYALSAYGISRALLPVDERNDLKPDEFRVWLQMRQIAEGSQVTPNTSNSNERVSERSQARRSSKSSEMDFGSDSTNDSNKVELPPGTKSEDVLLGGSGREFMWNAGNIIFRGLLGAHGAEYHATTSKAIKRSVCQTVIEKVRNEIGGRFMIRNDEGIWEEMEDDLATLKVSRAFRNRHRYTK